LVYFQNSIINSGFVPWFWIEILQKKTVNKLFYKFLRLIKIKWISIQSKILTKLIKSFLIVKTMQPTRKWSATPNPVSILSHLNDMSITKNYSINTRDMCTQFKDLKSNKLISKTNVFQKNWWGSRNPFPRKKLFSKTNSQSQHVPFGTFKHPNNDKEARNSNKSVLRTKKSHKESPNPAPNKILDANLITNKNPKPCAI